MLSASALCALDAASAPPPPPCSPSCNGRKPSRDSLFRRTCACPASARTPLLSLQYKIPIRHRRREGDGGLEERAGKSERGSNDAREGRERSWREAPTWSKRGKQWRYQRGNTACRQGRRGEMKCGDRGGGGEGGWVGLDLRSKPGLRPSFRHRRPTPLRQCNPSLFVGLCGCIRPL